MTSSWLPHADSDVLVPTLSSMSNLSKAMLAMSNTSTKLITSSVIAPELIRSFVTAAEVNNYVLSADDHDERCASQTLVSDLLILLRTSEAIAKCRCFALFL